MATDNFVFRKEWREALRGYSAEVRAEVYEAVLAYAFDNEIIEMSALSAMAFNFIKLQIDSMRDAYAKKCERNRARANKRWGNDTEDCDTMPSDAEPYQPMPSDAIKSIQHNTNQNNISLSNDERERVFEIFYFERNIAEPQKEAERFINYYEASGWCRAGSDKPVKSKCALARSWKVEREEKRLPDDVCKWLHSIYLRAKEGGTDAGLLFSIYCVKELTDRNMVQINCDQEVAEIIEAYATPLPRKLGLLYGIKRK